MPSEKSSKSFISQKDKIKIIATVGPGSMNEHTIKKMDESGVDMFRINMSHTDINFFESTVKQLKVWTNKPICPDTEGAQIRSSILGEELSVAIHAKINIVNSDSLIDSIQIGISGCNVYDTFFCGDLIKIDFEGVLIQIIQSDKRKIIGEVLTGGIIRNNKGVSIDRDISLSSFSQKDIKMIELAKNLGLDTFYLSFCSNGNDVKEMRNKFNYNIKIISKVESRKGLYNIKSICKESDAILIDRGDLSRDVPLEKIPFAQKYILDKGKSVNTPVFVATNLMENMINNSKPTRAEVNDIRSTLNDGADGLVLAAETAIGKYPVECVRIMSRIINEVNNQEENLNLKNLLSLPSDRMIAPHGSSLIQQYNDDNFIGDYTLIVDRSITMDATNIANGTYSPITDFMSIESINSVLNENKINNFTWTIPIIIQIDEKTASKMPHLGSCYLQNKGDDSPLCLLKNIKIEKLNNKSELATKWFGTNDMSHPGVRSFLTKGSHILSGQPFILNNYHRKNPFNLSPKQTRDIFDHNGWHNIIGFHTRNICHRGHEYIQLKALEECNADAIMISPVTGKKKKGDFTSNILISTYNELIKSGAYNPFGVLLNSFNTHSRYSGPREAIFTAICRKNYGCSHFIVGRDHTGVGNYYDSNASQKIFDEFDIGINIIFTEEIVYDENKDSYVENKNDQVASPKKLSGSIIRDYLMSNMPIPSYLLRPIIGDVLKEKIKENLDLVLEK